MKVIGRVSRTVYFGSLGLLLLVAIYLYFPGVYLWVRSVAEFERAQRDLEGRLWQLENRKFEQFSLHDVSGDISTTDQPLSADYPSRPEDPQDETAKYHIGIKGKFTPYVIPELRIPSNSADRRLYLIHAGGGLDHGLARAWLADWEPRDEIAKFDQFAVDGDGYWLRLNVKPKPGATIKMHFTLMILQRE